MITDQEIDAIEARLEATTEGWHWHGGTRIPDHLDDENGFVVDLSPCCPNGKFVILAHNRDIPDLIAKVRWLQKELHHIKYPPPPHDVDEFYKEDVQG